MSEKPSLIQRGYLQGVVLNCSEISKFPQVREAVEQGRAIPSKRQSSIEEKHFLVVLSQDCDINNTEEKFLELATVKPVQIKKASELVQRARNSRKLQLLVSDGCWEIESGLISVVPKSVLEEAETFNPEFALDEIETEILISWRVNRYVREPFPHPFNVGIINEYLHDPKTGFYEFFTRNRAKILDIYAFVDPKDDEEAESYLVSLTLVLRSGCEEQDVAEIEAEFRSHIEQINANPNRLTMLQAAGESGFHPELSNIELVCLPSDFSFQDAFCLRRVTLDFLCWD